MSEGLERWAHYTGEHTVPCWLAWEEGFGLLPRCAGEVHEGFKWYIGLQAKPLVRLMTLSCSPGVVAGVVHLPLGWPLHARSVSR